MSFLQREIERRESSDAYRDGTRSEEARGGTGGSERRKPLPGTASSFPTSSATNTFRCGFCNESHQSEKCYSILKLTRAEREEKVCSAFLCFRCLSKGHLSKGCRSKCTKCRGNHNVLFCMKDVLLVPKDNKVCDELEHLPSSENKGVNTETSTNTFVTHVGVALSLR